MAPHVDLEGPSTTDFLPLDGVLESVRAHGQGDPVGVGGERDGGGRG